MKLFLSHFQIPDLQTMQFHSRFRVLGLVLLIKADKYIFLYLKGPTEAKLKLLCLVAIPKDQSHQWSRWCWVTRTSVTNCDNWIVWGVGEGCDHCVQTSEGN